MSTTIKIESKGGFAEVYVDGKLLERACEVKIHMLAQRLPEVWIRVEPDILEMAGEAEVVLEAPYGVLRFPPSQD